MAPDNTGAPMSRDFDNIEDATIDRSIEREDPQHRPGGSRGGSSNNVMIVSEDEMLARMDADKDGMISVKEVKQFLELFERKQS